MGLQIAFETAGDSMNRVSNLALCVGLCCVAWCAGCYSTYVGDDAWPSSPLISGKQPISRKIKFTVGLPMKSSGKIVWVGNEGREYSGNRIAKGLGPILEDHSVHFVPWDQVTQHHRESIDNNPAVLEDANRVVTKTAVLVSIEPTVVVISDLPAATVYESDGLNAFHASTRAPELVTKGEERGDRIYVVGLPNGLLYGDTVPFSLGMEIVAPDPAIPSQRVEFDAEGKWTLPVAWGHIVLQRDGDVVRITADRLRP